MLFVFINVSSPMEFYSPDLCFKANSTNVNIIYPPCDKISFLHNTQDQFQNYMEVNFLTGGIIQVCMLINVTDNIIDKPINCNGNPRFYKLNYTTGLQSPAAALFNLLFTGETISFNFKFTPGYPAYTNTFQFSKHSTNTPVIYFNFNYTTLVSDFDVTSIYSMINAAFPCSVSTGTIYKFCYLPLTILLEGPDLNLIDLFKSQCILKYNTPCSEICVANNKMPYFYSFDKFSLNPCYPLPDSDPVFTLLYNCDCMFKNKDNELSSLPEFTILPSDAVLIITITSLFLVAMLIMISILANLIHNHF